MKIVDAIEAILIVFLLFVVGMVGAITVDAVISDNAAANDANARIYAITESMSSAGYHTFEVVGSVALADGDVVFVRGIDPERPYHLNIVELICNDTRCLQMSFSQTLLDRYDDSLAYMERE